MGDGLVLEQGTHSELLRDENGPYSRLVAAQKLREKREVEYKDSDSVVTDDGDTVDMEKMAQNEMPLGAKNSAHSLASDIIAQKKLSQGDEKKEEDYGLVYLFMRMGKLNQASWRNYGLGVVAASCIYPSVCSLLVFSNWLRTVSGMVHPAMGILYARGINGFADLDPHQRRHDGDRTALYYFTIAIISTCTIGLQNYLFASAAASLTARVRSLSFKAILRQDG
jgi:ATP-binding cassette, subfamily B (MDR/TAP), member 1